MAHGSCGGLRGCIRRLATVATAGFSAVQRAARTAVAARWFNSLVLAAIIVNSVLLAADNPLDDPASDKQQALRVLDLVRSH